MVDELPNWDTIPLDPPDLDMLRNVHAMYESAERQRRDIENDLEKLTVIKHQTVGAIQALDIMMKEMVEALEKRYGVGANDYEIQLVEGCLKKVEEVVSNPS
jgi:hypothetical protein